MFLKEFLVLVLFTCVFGQPGGGGSGYTGSGGPGSVASSVCTSISGSCNRQGSSNYMNRNLSYSTTTGVFSGHFISNSCPEHTTGQYGGTLASQGISYTATCYYQPVPATGYGSTVPQTLPLRNTVGWTVSGGSAIYGSMEAGFTLGQGCTNGKGICHSGMDVDLCVAKLKYECGVENWDYPKFADDCGGHATPYHYHSDISCTKSGYSGIALSGSAHSPLVGIMLDGHGLYGQFESGSTRPTDLDACGGHTGPVPATTVDGTYPSTYPAATSVYHYHTQNVAPFVPACFGPVTSLQACKDLYQTCASTSTKETICTTLGQITYLYDCPCFQNMPTSETFNQDFTSPCTNTTTSDGSSAAPSALMLLGLMLFAKLY